MIVTLFSLTGIALLFSLILTPAVRLLAVRCGLVDLPGARKVHVKAIPRIGGVAVFASYFGSCLLIALLCDHVLPGMPGVFSAIRSIAPATLLIFSIGLLDDIFTLKPWHKLAVQVLAACLVISAGVHVGESYFFFGHPWLARAASLAWLLLCTNAVNLIDGLDGLAAGIALLATMTTLIASLMSGNLELTIAAAPLAGALIGFLVFNSNPASIFLGDSGSLVLGFMLGCFSLLWSVKSATLLGMAAPLMAVSVPLIDTTLAVVRRFLRGQPIFSSDRSHVHHRLLTLGLTHRRAVLLLYSAGAIASVLSLSLLWARSHGEMLVLLAFVSLVLLGVEKLRYPELNAARNVLFKRGFRHEINAHLEVQKLQESLDAARTAEDCWRAIQRNGRDFDFEVVGMHLAGRTFGRLESAITSSMIRIGVTQKDWVDIAFDSDSAKRSFLLAPFVTTVMAVVSSKHLPALEQQEATPVRLAFPSVISPLIQ